MNEEELNFLAMKALSDYAEGNPFVEPWTHEDCVIACRALARKRGHSLYYMLSSRDTAYIWMRAAAVRFDASFADMVKLEIDILVDMEENKNEYLRLVDEIFGLFEDGGTGA